MYIRFLIKNNEVIYKGKAKPIVEEREFIDLNGKCAVAEYKGEIPKNNYLTVTNLREETETWVEKKIIYKLDEDGLEILDENGSRIVDKEIEETKTRAYLACDLVANFYPPKTEEELAKIAAKARIKELKTKLDESDYKAIKFAEGVLTEEEYAPIREERQRYRDEINQLESLI